MNKFKGLKIEKIYSVSRGIYKENANLGFRYRRWFRLVSRFLPRLAIKMKDNQIKERLEGFAIHWSSDSGFGELTFYYKSSVRGNIFECETETMDNGDKTWVKAVLSLLADKFTIIE